MTVPLSIIIPMLDEAAGIEHTLRVLVPMRARGVEVIVADGGSRDGSQELATALADVVIAAPRGRALQMNAGASAARGEILLFLHADTTLPDGADALILKAIADDGRVWGRFDVTIQGRSRMLPVIAAMMNLRSRLTGIATGDQAMFATRTAFFAAGAFPAQPLMEDIALSKSLKVLSAPACLRQRAMTSGRRWESRGVWTTILLMWSLRLRYWCGAPAETLAKAYRK